MQDEIFTYRNESLPLIILGTIRQKLLHEAEETVFSEAQLFQPEFITVATFFMLYQLATVSNISHASGLRSLIVRIVFSQTIRITKVMPDSVISDHTCLFRVVRDLAIISNKNDRV